MGFRGTPCHGVVPQGEDGSRTVLGAKKRPCSTLHPPIATVLGAKKKDLAPRCIHRSQTEPFLELEKNMLCDIF